MIWERGLWTRANCIYVMSLVDPDLFGSAPFFMVVMCDAPIIKGRDKAMGVMVGLWNRLDYGWRRSCLARNMSSYFC